jgi:hypothetical protein
MTLSGGRFEVCTFSWGDVNNSGNCTTICNGEESRFAFECHARPYVRSRAKWRSTAMCMAAWSRSQSAVLPSMSVKRKVTLQLARRG